MTSFGKLYQEKKIADAAQAKVANVSRSITGKGVLIAAGAAVALALIALAAVGAGVL